MPQLINLVVNRGIFFNKGVGRWNVGFRLIVVVITDEIFDPVFGEEIFELLIELGRQSLIRSDHQGSTLNLGNNLGQGKSLPRTGDSEKHLFIQTRVKAGT